jgi:hypothetical protein
MGLFRQGKALPLAFHVDYWDYLGWKDPYSSPVFTDRQKRYAMAFGADSLYTPQMVVAGRTAFVGSDAQRAAKELEERQGAKYGFNLSLSASRKEGRLDLEMGAHPPVGAARRDDLKAFAVIFENGLSNRIPRGENAGRTLSEEFVVKALQEVGTSGLWDGRITRIDIPWDPAWKPQNCGAAVFLQDGKTMEIKGLDWAYPLAR